MSKRDLYYKMMKLIEQEEEVVKRVRKAEDEVKKKPKNFFKYYFIF